MVLVDALTDAEAAGNTLENALEKLADIEPEFVLDEGTVLDEIRGHLERLERVTAARETVTSAPNLDAGNRSPSSSATERPTGERARERAGQRDGS